MRISDWSSDVCSSDLRGRRPLPLRPRAAGADPHPGPCPRHAGLPGRPPGLAPPRRYVLHRDSGDPAVPDRPARDRSEEHTSELQSLMRISYAVFCLKKKTITNYSNIKSTHIHLSIT